MTEGNAWTNQSGFLPLKDKLDLTKKTIYCQIARILELSEK